jgi:hypothetical protein
VGNQRPTRSQRTARASFPSCRCPRSGLSRSSAGPRHRCGRGPVGRDRRSSVRLSVTRCESEILKTVEFVTNFASSESIVPDRRSEVPRSPCPVAPETTAATGRGRRLSAGQLRIGRGDGRWPQRTLSRVPERPANSSSTIAGKIFFEPFDTCPHI